ncbi:MAG TPA: hypothetical protein VII01_11770 [Solirubrobacteraceae bacterium]
MEPNPKVHTARLTGFRATGNEAKILKAVELMPETKAKRKPAAKTQAPRGKRRPSASRSDAAQAAKRTTELSDDVLKSLDDGARSAIESVRKFVETVDEALPPHGDGPSKREEITDSALQMAERLVHTQYEFLHKVIDSAGKSVTRSGNAK